MPKEPKEPKEKKAKRKPSGYNLHIKKCMGKNADQIKGKPFGTAAKFMKGCTEEWNKMTDEQKGKFKEFSDFCVQNKEGVWDCPTEK